MIKRLTLGSSAAAIILASANMQAHELYKDENRVFNLDVSAMFGFFHSSRSYAAINPDTRNGSKSWREGSIKYGFSGTEKLAQGSGLAAGLSWVSSATWGDGDAARITNGKERRTHIEDAWLGWKSGQLISALGEDGLDISFGRQFASVGSGFLIFGDPVSMGEGIADGALNRGGAYYLAPRNSFGRTAVISLGGAEGLRGDLMYLKSANPAQAKTKLHVANVEHITESSTVGATFIKGHDVDKKYADDFQLQRKGMKAYSLRGNSGFGIENLDLAAEYVWQRKKHATNGKAWYAQASWNFSKIGWQPAMTYRYSRFSENFDPLFYGLSTGFGTWFQGEVAGNYAGPFNSNTKVHHLGATLQPREDVALGALAFRFNTLDKKQGDLSGKELNLYVQWDLNDHLSIIPVTGWYSPKKDALNNGAQLKNRKNNFYSQLLFMTQF